MEKQIKSLSEEENEPEIVPEAKPASGPTKKIVPVVLAIVVIILGITSGYFLAGLLGKKGKAELSGTTGITSVVVKGKEYGVKNVDGKDTAIGTIEQGGLNGEGTHKLLREGGPSQTVYLTSSAVDLDQFVGKKVQIWGETFKGQKTGWFMDVLKVKVLE